ncbi:MAG: C1 family peptidase [Bacteroidales bacterium]|nr:C1 family peptidase [Bacteroidales bacterium]
MKKRNLQLIIKVFFVLFVFNAYGQNTVKITQSNINQRVALAQNQILEINLPSESGTGGYSWNIKNLNKNIVDQFGDWEYVSDRKEGELIVGGPGKQVIKFYGVSKGETELELEYARVWEKNKPALQTYKITVVSEGIYNGTEKPYNSEPLKTNYKYTPSKAYPTSFNWQDFGIMTPATDQGNCPNCWAFATNGVFEALIKAMDATEVDLSEQALSNCLANPPGCGGGWCQFAYLKSTGNVLETTEPYLNGNGTCVTYPSYPYKALDFKRFISYDSWHYAPTDANGVVIGTYVDTIKKYMYKYGPIWAVGRLATSKFDSYSGGIFADTFGTAKQQFDHAILLCGWDDNAGDGYWVMKNSWGDGWGVNGFGLVKWFPNTAIGMDPYYCIYKNGPLTSVISSTTNDAVKVYPNPSDGKFTIRLNNLSAGDKNLVIENVLGQKIYNETFDQTTYNKKFDFTNYSKGIYLVRLSDKDRSFLTKLIIK